jgi:predicted TPR repeat methyltransferase
MVDLGCGTGFLAELAPSRIQKIIGVDTTEQMLDVLRRKKLPRVELLVESVCIIFCSLVKIRKTHTANKLFIV